MRKLLGAVAALALFATSASATVSIIQKQVAAPTSAPAGFAISPFDFCSDGTNSWPCGGIFDGTTQAIVEPTTKALEVYLAGGASGVVNPNGQATALNSSPVVLPAAQVTADPCALGVKTNLPISTAATALTQIIAVSGTTKIYICSLNLTAPGATAFSLIRGTGTNCATGTPTAVMGSTTAANGMSFAANGGLTLGNGAGTIGSTNASDELCTLQSNAVQVAGNLTYVQAP